MPLVIGVLLALGVSLLAWAAGFDRDRSFYPTVLCVVASYYVLFAVMGGSIQVLVAELVTMTVFALVAFLGFKSSLWWVAAALAGHGGFDFVHGFVVQNPGMPTWWPPFCAGYDVAAGAILAALLKSRRLR
ncbi:MAG TPA: hypothetical protein VGQ33_20320 [Vicinamibacteria bacterium]|nr:hypothetical protein [Vicinamibacteria bacterium]